MLVLKNAVNICIYRTSTSESMYCEVDLGIDGTFKGIGSNNPHLYSIPDGADTLKGQRGLDIEVKNTGTLYI